jgi:hypothetical protein
MNPVLCSALRRFLVAGWLAGLAAWPAFAADPAEAAIRQVLMAEFDKPEARLEVAPVVVAGQASVASWAQGSRGGRALLFQKGGQWHMALCSGDALKNPGFLEQAGVAKKDAQTLTQALAAAEAKLTPAQRARFSSFDGTVRMDATGQHPPGHKH